MISTWGKLRHRIAIKTKACKNMTSNSITYFSEGSQEIKDSMSSKDSKFNYLE